MKPGLALVVLALPLFGCVHTEVVDDRLGFVRRQAELSAVADWDMRGGIAVDDGESAYQARFSWQQRGDELELVVRSRVPGTRSFRVEGNEARLTVESRGETEILTDPERQLSEMLRWWMPVTSVPYWLLGRPDPDYPAQSYMGTFDTLAGLAQRDWQISYDEYQLAEGRLVPRDITLTHARLELKLTIIDWLPAGANP